MLAIEKLLWTYPQDMQQKYWSLLSIRQNQDELFNNYNLE